jgi:hypothetical protein
MTATIKLLANTVTLDTSNNTIGGARVVRLLARSPILITQFDTVANVQVGTIQMLGNSELTLVKKPTDWLTSNDAANCVAVAIAYSN